MTTGSEEERAGEGEPTIGSDQASEALDEASTREAIVEAILGHPARLITWSKSGYHRSRPDHLVIFNAGVYAADGTEIWWGDLDLTNDEIKVGDLARTLGEQILVVHEGSRRYFERESTEKDAFAATIREGAIVVADPDGTVSVASSWARRDDSGTIRLVHPWPTDEFDTSQSQEPDA